jgi:hypothetical protein
MGGIAVFVKRDLNDCVRRRNPTCNFAVILEIVSDIFSNKKTELIFTYLPPESSPFYTDNVKGVKLLESLLNELCIDDNIELILMGDLNARTGIVAEFIQGVSQSVEIDAFADLFSTDEKCSIRVSNDTQTQYIW